MLTGLFAARVAAQLVQLIAPQPWLPSFERFQGSDLPYPALLVAQLAILGTMTTVAWRAAAGALQRSGSLARFLRIAGWIYLAVMSMRLAVGLIAPNAGAWFAAPIPALFHLVLATFVLTWAAIVRPVGVPGETE